MNPRWVHLDGCAGVYITGFGAYVKIGFSTRIGARLRELECGTPETLTLYRILTDGSREDEKRLHRLFRDYRLRNEWFWLKGDLKEFAGSDPLADQVFPVRSAFNRPVLQLVKE